MKAQPGASTNLEFKVTTVPPSASQITYTWETSSEADDTATAGTDYTTAGDY